MKLKVLSNLLHNGVLHLRGAIVDPETHLPGADVDSLKDRGLLTDNITGEEEKVEESTQTQGEEIAKEEGIEEEEKEVETNDVEDGGSEDKEEESGEEEKVEGEEQATETTPPAASE